MKVANTILAFALFVFAIAFVHSQSVTDCNPDSDGQPDCATADIGTAYRDFFDPVHYWMCYQSSGVAQKMACPTGTGFNSTNGCIPWSQWVWTPPCSS